MLCHLKCRSIITLRSFQLEILNKTRTYLSIELIERPSQIILGIWIEIVYSLIGLLDCIKGNAHQPELKRLEFHAVLDIGILYRQLVDNVEWFDSAPKYLFKPMVRI